MTPRNPASFRPVRSALALMAGTVFSAIAALSPLQAQDAPVSPDTVIVTVNGEAITEGDVAIAAYELRSMLENVPMAQQKATVLDALIELKLIADLSETLGYDQTDDFARRVEYLRKEALRYQFVTNNIIGPIDDGMVRTCYDNLVAGMTTDEEVRASHILVASEQEAIDIIAQLRAGADFAELARTRSTDAGSGQRGGDLGFFGRGQMVPEFETAAFAMEPGAITEQPVQSQFGWHVIRLEERRMVPPPPFDQVESEVRQIVYGELYGAWLAALRQNAVIAAPEAPPAPGAPAPVPGAPAPVPGVPPMAAAPPVVVAPPTAPTIVPTEAVQCLAALQPPPPSPPAPAPAPAAPVAPAPAAPVAPAPVAPAPEAPAPAPVAPAPEAPAPAAPAPAPAPAAPAPMAPAAPAP